MTGRLHYWEIGRVDKNLATSVYCKTSVEVRTLFSIVKNDASVNTFTAWNMRNDNQYIDWSR